MGRGAAVTVGGHASTSERHRAPPPSTTFETFAPRMMSERYERAQVWGLDCCETLRWKFWEPGGTYVRSVVLKNVSTRALKVKYKLPKTKYFEMEFPETIKLSPGMSVPVDVTFRPIKREQYDDYVEFKVAGCGVFKVRVTAALPVLSLKVPDAVDFGYGAVNETMRKTFAFSNDGEVPVDFAWKIDPPFIFAPLTGRLAPGETQHVRCEFTPTDATVNVADARCEVEPEHEFHDGMKRFATRVSAVGKYPFIRLSDKELDFGEVIVGKTAERTFKVLNQSVVAVTYECARVDAEHDHVFKVDSRGGKLRRDAHDVVKVTYAPAMPGTFSAEAFRFTTPGGRHDTVLRLRGTATGPSASLSASTLQFGSVVKGTSVRRVFDVQNHSEVAMHWQIDSEKLGTFALDVDRGLIPAKASQRVLVTFAPIEAANYHRRLTVLARDRAPLAIDVVGTCYDDKRRPAPMFLSHVETYRARCRVGLCDPGEPPLVSDREPFEDEVAQARAAATTNAEAFASAFEPDPLCAVVLDTREVDFGARSRLNHGDAKVVTVTNGTKQKLTVFWGGQEPTQAGDNSETALEAARGAAERAPFAVFPPLADVRPGQAQPFRVVFRPTKDHAYYTRQLECFAYVKAMRSFRQVTEENFTPPWTASVRALGHTFGHLGATMGFMPRCRFTARGNRLLFPPTVKGERSYQTLALVNDGDVSVGFEFPSKRVGSPEAAASADSRFAASPTKGVVGPKSFALITFRFDASDCEPQRELLVCALNGSSTHCLELDVRAQGHVPKLRVGSDDSFVFKPTCVGAVTARDVDVTNVSRINVLYEWAIPPKLQSTLRVTPPAGMIRGGETIKSTWTFIPSLVKRVGARVPLVLRVPHSYDGGAGGAAPTPRVGTPASAMDDHSRSDANTERVTVSIVAEGTSGAIAMVPERLDFGACVVDATTTRVVELLNQSSGVVRYRMDVIWDEGCSEFDADVRFDEPTGLIPARAGKAVTVRFTGRATCAEVGFRVACRTVVAPTLGPSGSSRSLLTLEPSGASAGSLFSHHSRGVRFDDHAEGGAGEGIDGAGGEEPPCVPARASAEYPSIRVTDAASSAAVAKPALWKQLSLCALNAQLALPPTPTETRLQQTGGADGSFASAKALAPLAGVAAGLGVGVEGEEPTCVYLEVSNPGLVEAEWSILLRNEPEVALENWVEVGEPQTEVDAHQRFVLEEKIVEVTPRRGALAPGASQPIRIKYSHDHVGAHWLTATLSVKNGRTIRVELGGRTVPRTLKCLDLGPANPSVAVHTLAPVVIGELEPPAQTIELRNPTPSDARYELDLAAVEDLNADAWDFPVLTCVERSGVVPAFGTALVNFVFQPVEEKTYEVEVPVLIEDGETTSVTLRGAGTLPEPPPRRKDAADASDENKASNSKLDASLVGDVPGRPAWVGYRPVPSLPPVGDFALSTSSCVVGEVPALSVTRRVVLLSNRNPGVDFDYAWDLGAFGESGVDGDVTVEPRSGRVERGETVVFKITFEAREKPQVFDGRITCELTPANPSVEELREEARLEEERLRAPEVFAEHTSQPWPSMPTAKELEGGTEIWGKIAAHGEASQRMSVVDAATVSSAARWPELAERGARNHASSISKPPKPPAPARLALAIEGRVVPEVRFREEKGADAYARHFIPSHRPEVWWDPGASRGGATLSSPDAEDLIAGLIHDTLADPDVRRGFDELEREPIPFYVQTLPGGGAPAGTLTRKDAATAGSTIAPESTLAASDWAGGSGSGGGGGGGGGGSGGESPSGAASPSAAAAAEEEEEEEDEDDEPLPDELPDAPHSDADEDASIALRGADASARSLTSAGSVGSVGSAAVEPPGVGGAGTAAPTTAPSAAARWVDGDETGGIPSTVDPREVALATANPEFRELAEWTMEATLFNLVKELLYQETEDAAFDEEEEEGDGDGFEFTDSGGEESYGYGEER